MNYKKTVQELLDRLPPDQYIAVGSGVPRRSRKESSGSGFYFIGQVKRYRKDIDGINGFFKGVKEYTPLEDRVITDIRNRHIPGEPPMLAILAEGTEAGRYWTLGEYDKRFKAPPAKIKDMNGLHNLRHAITMRAVSDYEEAVMDPRGSERKGITTDLVGNFLKGDWGSLITGIDGQKIEDVCRLRARYKMWRKRHDCNKCKREKCIHYSGEHFTTMERGRLVCQKEDVSGD